MFYIRAWKFESKSVGVNVFSTITVRKGGTWFVIPHSLDCVTINKSFEIDEKDFKQ